MSRSLIEEYMHPSSLSERILRFAAVSREKDTRQKAATVLSWGTVIFKPRYCMKNGQKYNLNFVNI